MRFERGKTHIPVHGQVFQVMVGPVLTAVDSYNQGKCFLLGVFRKAQYAVRILYWLVIQVRNNVVKGKGICAFKFDPFPIIQSGSGY